MDNLDATIQTRTMSVMSLTDLDEEPARSPAAIRLRRPGWRDPRLIVGVLLVAVSTVLGARLFAAADDSVPVWATSTAVRAGDDVGEAQLIPARAKLADGASVEAYLGTGTAPVGVFDRDLQPGELVPAGAVDPPDAAVHADVPVAVAAGDAPVDLATGDLVDVWSVPDLEPGGREPEPARRVLSAVSVAVAGAEDTLGGGDRQLVVRVDPAGSSKLGDVLGGLGAGRVVLVRVGG